jgi:hypothetical protein
LSCRNRFWVRIGVAVAVYAVVAAAFTYPLIFRLDKAVLGWPGDNLEYVWKMWWVKHALLDLRASPLYAPHIYYPYGLNMAKAELTPSHTFLALPLTALFGPVASYNLAVLVSFVLSGLGMYILMTAYTSREGPALIAGLAFAFSPYRVAHSVGHLPLMGTGWIPLTFWAAERWRGTRRPAWAALSGLFFGLTCLSSWYYAAFAVLAFGVFLLVRFRPWRRALWQPSSVVSGLLFVVLAGVLILPFAIPYYQVMAGGGLTHPFGLVLWGSARPADFVVPNLLHPLWGAALQRAFPSQTGVFVERSIYLSWVALVLASAAVVGPKGQSAVWAWVAVGVLALLIAHGPLLMWGEKEIALSAPATVKAVLVRSGAWSFLQRFTTREGKFLIPRPALVLRLFVPGFASIRVWARMAVFATLAVVVLAGVGLDRLCGRLERRGFGRVSVIAMWTAGGLLLLDLIAIPPLWPGIGTYVASTEPRPVDVWLSEQPQGALVEFPLTLSGPPMYHSITHGKRIVTGYGTFVPLHFQEAEPVLRGFPSTESLSLLESWGVRYILVNSGRYGVGWSALMEQLQAIDTLVLTEEAGGIFVYLLR